MQGILNRGECFQATAPTLSDLAISHMAATSNIKTFYRCVGAVSTQRERAKEAKHSAKARAVGYRFYAWRDGAELHQATRACDCASRVGACGEHHGDERL